MDVAILCTSCDLMFLAVTMRCPDLGMAAGPPVHGHEVVSHSSIVLGEISHSENYGQTFSPRKQLKNKLVLSYHHRANTVANRFTSLEQLKTRKEYASSCDTHIYEKLDLFAVM